MTEIEYLRLIARFFSDASIEALAYRSRIAQSGAAQERLDTVTTYSQVMDNFSAFYSEQAATIVAGLTLEHIVAIKDATENALLFIKKVNQVKRGIGMLGALVSLASSGFKGDIASGLSAIDTIQTIIDEAVNDNP